MKSAAKNARDIDTHRYETYKAKMRKENRKEVNVSKSNYGGKRIQKM